MRRILQASLEVTIFFKKKNRICFLLLLFYRKPCSLQQNIVNFKHARLLMNYLSFVSLDTIEALFLFFLWTIFITPVRLMNYEICHFIRIIRRCFPWGLLLGIYHQSYSANYSQGRTGNDGLSDTYQGRKQFIISSILGEVHLVKRQIKNDILKLVLILISVKGLKNLL